MTKTLKKSEHIVVLSPQGDINFNYKIPAVKKIQYNSGKNIEITIHKMDGSKQIYCGLPFVIVALSTVEQAHAEEQKKAEQATKNSPIMKANGINLPPNLQKIKRK